MILHHIFLTSAGIIAFVALWCLGGMIITITYAWLNARLHGNDWFSPRQRDGTRWSSTTDNLPPAAFVFLLWPLAIPIAILYGMVMGFGRLTEKLGDKVIVVAERQAKAARE